MNKEQEIRDIMAHAIGTTAYHRFSSFQFFPVATDGVMAVAEAAGCFWLLDIIGSYQMEKELDPHFQVWTLTVDKEQSSGIVRGYNDTTLIIRQDIPYTDFPLDEIKMYLMDGVILLPNER
jgi:hypothetical protein